MCIQIGYRVLGSANSDRTDLVYMARKVRVALELKIAKFDLQKDKKMQKFHGILLTVNTDVI